MKNKQDVAIIHTPKKIYLTLIILGAILMTFDHLTSNALTDVGSPSELGNACAPCGAPCVGNQSK